MPASALLDWFVTKTLARDPRDRFQNAREMLEHWWNVMSSLDAGAPTEARSTRRAEDARAGALRRDAHGAQDAGLPPSLSAVDPPVDPLSDPDDERTVRRPRLSLTAVPATTPMTQPPVSVPGSSIGEVTLPDPAPRTEQSPLVMHVGDEGDDPFDLPTRNDPDLRARVARELELHRKGKRPPR
jgi:hypothetical protein